VRAEADSAIRAAEQSYESTISQLKRDLISKAEALKKAEMTRELQGVEIEVRPGETVTTERFCAGT